MRPSCLQMAGKRDMKKTNRTPKSGLLTEFSPGEANGPVAIWSHPTGVILGDRTRFFDLLILRTATFYLFLFFFLSPKLIFLSFTNI